jgi:hypothetical protein
MPRSCQNATLAKLVAAVLAKRVECREAPATLGRRRDTSARPWPGLGCSGATMTQGYPATAAFASCLASIHSLIHGARTLEVMRQSATKVPFAPASIHS